MDVSLIGNIRLMCELSRMSYSLVGTNSFEVPPVPIPNTEVKLKHAEDT